MQGKRDHEPARHDGPRAAPWQRVRVHRVYKRTKRDGGPPLAPRLINALCAPLPAHPMKPRRAYSPQRRTQAPRARSLTRSGSRPGSCQRRSTGRTRHFGRSPSPPRQSVSPDPAHGVTDHGRISPERLGNPIDERPAANPAGALAGRPPPPLRARLRRAASGHVTAAASPLPTSAEPPRWGKPCADASQSPPHHLIPRAEGGAGSPPPPPRRCASCQARLEAQTPLLIATLSFASASRRRRRLERRSAAAPLLSRRANAGVWWAKGEAFQPDYVPAPRRSSRLLDVALGSAIRSRAQDRCRRGESMRSRRSFVVSWRWC